MSHLIDLFLQRIRRTVDGAQPAVTAALLAALDTLRARLGERDVLALVEQGATDRILTLALSDANLDATLVRFRAKMQMTVGDAVAYFGKDIPNVSRGTVAVTFDALNPRVIDALRALDTVVMSRLKDEIRGTVRQILLDGMQEGRTVAATARELRDFIGIGPTQYEQALNFRAALVEGDTKKALQYLARDRRFDASIKAGTLTPQKIDTLFRSYVRRRIALNAEATSRTATIEAYKLGQRLSWEDAIQRGIVDRSRLMRQWATVMDGRERPEHHEMNGAITTFDAPYSNGDAYAGEGSPWNCRCADIVFLADT